MTYKCKTCGTVVSTPQAMRTHTSQTGHAEFRTTHKPGFLRGRKESRCGK